MNVIMRIIAALALCVAVYGAAFALEIVNVNT